MKATGIVRRIDDLGRVVIPKEIRRTMRIREGDPFSVRRFAKRNSRSVAKQTPIDTFRQVCMAIHSFVKRYNG